MADSASIKANLLAPFRDFAIDGVPASGPNEPEKPLIRNGLGGLIDFVDERVSNVELAQVGGAISYASKASMDADLTPADRSTAYAFDASLTNQGVYRKSGASGAGSWVRMADLPPAFLDVAGFNQFRAGKSPDEAEFTFTTNTVSDVVGSNLIALGLTRGVSRGVSETSVIYGERLARTLIGNEFFAARVFIEMDSGNPVPRLYFYSGGGTTLLTFLPMVLEETLSATEKVYSVFGQCTGTMAGADLVGVGAAIGTGVNVRVAGGQFAVTPRRMRAINRGDYPPEGATDDPIIPAKMFGVEGIELPIYPENFMTRRLPLQTVAEFATFHDTTRAPHFRKDREMLLVDPAKCGSSARIVTRPIDRDFSRRREMTVGIGIAPASRSGSPNILLVGDSLTNRGQAKLIKDRLVARGMTPTMLGTMGGQDEAGSDIVYGGGYDGEGREGVSAQEYCNNTATLTPVAIGTEATYLAASKSSKLGQNPFVVTTDYATAQGYGYEAGFARNGYVVSFQAYAARFLGGASPDVVVIGLGTNDFTEGSSVANFIAHAEILVIQARLAFPAAKILWWMPTTPRSRIGDDRWFDGYVDYLKALNAFFRGLGDANAHLVGTWLHMSQEADWDLASATAPNAQTGVRHAALEDVIHFGRKALREQVSETLTAAIMVEA